MYPRSKFQEVLLEIRHEMAREADFDVDLYAEIIRTGAGPQDAPIHSMADQNAKSDDRALNSERKPGIKIFDGPNDHDVFSFPNNLKITSRSRRSSLTKARDPSHRNQFRFYLSDA